MKKKRQIVDEIAAKLLDIPICESCGTPLSKTGFDKLKDATVWYFVCENCLWIGSLERQSRLQSHD